MTDYLAPAKVNLSLHVSPLGRDGFHPLESLVQTVEFCDVLTVEESSEWSLDVDGADIDPEDNLVTRAFNSMSVSRVQVRLEKRIPVAAGMGGGSSDAAAALVAAGDFGGDVTGIADQAISLGSDVPLFLTGGTQLMSGRGDVLEPERPLSGFALAIVVPDFRLDTAAVYERWDEMEGPAGEAPSDQALPPPLRDGMPLRNDLLPAALDIEPQLGDFMADVRSAWDQPVLLTGSGPACFGFFATVGEATAAAAVVHGTRAAAGVELRDRGVARR